MDRAGFAVALAERLRRRGVPVGITGIEDLARALTVSPPVTRSRLYWAARISLVRRHAEIEIFDAVFDATFGSGGTAPDPHARRDPLPRVPPRDEAHGSVPAADTDGHDGAALPWATLPPAVSSAADSDAGPAVPERLPSDLAGLDDVPFEQLDPAELALLGGWLEAAAADWPTRRTRRRRLGVRGSQIGLRATIERARRTGWEAIDLVRTRPVDKPRRVVMLCDVSQSMQAQAQAYFHLMRALALVADAEVFAFATSLTRLTPVLAHKSADAAIEQATAQVTDRFGGTRIGTNVRALLASHHGEAVRGGIVVIGSDGWDSDPPDLLAAAMVRLRRRAYRVIWMNPRAAAPGYEPRVGAMAAALPYCDQLLPADTFRSLRRVVDQVTSSRA